jgi:hypothetical protein
MISDSSDTERLYFVSLCDPAHERPKSFLKDFAPNDPNTSSLHKSQIRGRL